MSLHGRNRGCRTTPTPVPLQSPQTGALLGEAIFHPICRLCVSARSLRSNLQTKPEASRVLI